MGIILEVGSLEIVTSKRRCDECQTYLLEDYGAYWYCVACGIKYPKAMQKEMVLNQPIESIGEKFCHMCRRRYDGPWASHKGECRG